MEATAVNTPTVRVQTISYRCSACGVIRSALTLDLHEVIAHEDEDVTWEERISTYGQPASFPVRVGDIVISPITPEVDVQWGEWNLTQLADDQAAAIAEAAGQ